MILLETSHKSIPIVLADEYPKDYYHYKDKTIYLLASDYSICNSWGSTCSSCPFQHGPGGCSEAASEYLKSNFIHSHPELFI